MTTWMELEDIHKPDTEQQMLYNNLPYKWALKNIALIETE
jgi:hypothetical protein